MGEIGIRKQENTKKGRLSKGTPAPHKTYDPLQILDQQDRIYMDLDMQIQGVRTLNECKNERMVHVHIQCEHSVILLV